MKSEKPDQRQSVEEFGERLKRIREEKEMSQVQLARRAGVSRQIIQAYERKDGHSPTLVMVGKLAKALNVSVEVLVVGTGQFRGSRVDKSMTAPYRPTVVKLFREVPRNAMEKTDARVSITEGAEIAANAKQPIAVEISSDEMFPTLMKGDIVLFDLAPGNPRSRDIIAGFYDGNKFYRRYTVRGREKHLVADNPNYPDIKIDPAKLKIVGQAKMIVQRAV